MKFKNINDLVNHVKSRTNVSGASFSKSIEATLYVKGEELKNILLEEIDNYYNSYHPKKYVRTYNFLKSVQLGMPKNKDGINYIEITFDNALAYHDSVMGKNQPKGYVITLINYGWDISSKVGFTRERFTHYGGFDFIEKTIERYNSQNSDSRAVVVGG